MSSSESPNEQNGDQPAVDLHRLLLEIDEEVRAKRASGELSADLERELDLVFARFAPAGAVEGDFDQLLERAESQAFFDLIAPNESVRPGVPYVKRVVQKTVRWYVRYVVEQITSFAHTIAKATRQLNDRVSVVEELTAPADEFAALRSYLPSTGMQPWDSAIVDALRGIEGRVLHARCASGALVKQLQEAGVDAYGVDPAAELVAIGTAGSAGLDLRPDDERAHLSVLAPGSLAGLVLTDCTDVLARGAQVAIAELAAIVLRSGGMLVLVSTNPQAWAQTRSPVEVDLSTGRPMHIETWQHLLLDRGFSQIEISHSQPAADALLGHGSDATMNANIDKLNALLFPSTSSLLIAKR